MNEESLALITKYESATISLCSWVTVLFPLLHPKWRRAFLLLWRTSPACPVLLVVARLWAKMKSDTVFFATAHANNNTAWKRYGCWKVEKSVSTLSNVALNIRLWLQNRLFAGWLLSTTVWTLLQIQIFTSKKWDCTAGTNLVYKVHQVVNISSLGFGSNICNLFSLQTWSAFCVAGQDCVEAFFSLCTPPLFLLSLPPCRHPAVLLTP